MQAISILVATSLAYPGVADIIPGPLAETGHLPDGSLIQLFSILDSEKALNIPSPEFLRQYDAILIFTDAWPAEPYMSQYDTIGDLLADYVDGGGGLVMCQYAMYDGSARIQGRICSPGYAPLKSGPLELLRVDRSIAIASLDFPLHPIFQAIDIDTLLIPGDRLAHPLLDETALLLAKDDLETNAIAINARGNIVSLNMSMKAFAFSDYREAIKLIANSLVFTAHTE
jgi:hypothetical protein